MKFYLDGRLLFVDMIHRYAYVVVEGDRPPISYHFTRDSAERSAAEQRERRREYIRQFEQALDLDEITRMQEAPARLYRSIREDYPTPSAIHAAIQRQKKTLASIRVEPLEAVE